jgi:hypothetical protein
VLPQPPPPPPDIRASYQSIIQSVDDPSPPPAVIAAPQWEIPVKSWLTEQPWRTFQASTQRPAEPDGLDEVEVGVDDYRVRPSALQSCPPGMIMLDVDCVADWRDAPKVPAADHVAERLRLSRVIEVDVESGAVMTVLAARDSAQ